MVYAVRDVTLKARAGQLIAIVGPVGCGKVILLFCCILFFSTAFLLQLLGNKNNNFKIFMD